MPGSNQRPTDYKSVALPAELIWPVLLNPVSLKCKAHRGCLKERSYKNAEYLFFKGVQKYVKKIFVQTFFEKENKLIP